MPDRLPRELRVLHELARVVAAGPYTLEEVLTRVRGEVQSEFGFVNVRLVRDGDDLLLETALSQRRAVGDGRRVAIPLLVEGRCLGYLVADCGDAALELGEIDLHLLSTFGLVAGVFVAKAQQYEELQRALDELRRADRMKDDFLSIASHELRTPLAVVHGIAATLHARGDALTREQVVELRRTLFEQSLRLRDLTEQLLDLSRLDSGTIRVEPKLFHPREAVDSLVPRIAPERAGDVQVEIDPGDEVVSDCHAFDRVVGNLIGNALKYGEPPVLVSGSPEAGRFRLAVEDRGPGVPRAFVPHLFERFTRADEARRSPGGAGLGLAIAHEFAGAVGGELGYEPAQPKGARFVFNLPLATRP